MLRLWTGPTRARFVLDGDATDRREDQSDGQQNRKGHRHDHNAARCIFPIRGPGEHGQPSGSAAAVEYFRRRLRRDPGNLETRWLLNVASMTLGRYPGDVPPGVLIPPSAFESADDPGRFVDTARAMGLDAPGGAGGVVVDDVDGDGRFDVAVSSVDPCAALRQALKSIGVFCRD